jgi:predicted HD phosphohydrolase
MRTVTDLDALMQLLRDGAGAHDAPHQSGTEAVDLLSHGLQCAERLRTWHPEDLELQVAGLVHDIGHLLQPGEDATHGVTAAAAIRELLGERVARLVEHHVPAKRYLVTTDANYLSRLSPVSVETLTAQGGLMTHEEVIACEQLPDWNAGLELRRADEAAKSPGRVVPGLDAWRPVIAQVISATHTR